MSDPGVGSTESKTMRCESSAPNFVRPGAAVTVRVSRSALPALSSCWNATRWLSPELLTSVTTRLAPPAESPSLRRMALRTSRSPTVASKPSLGK
ncbi:hypothetical protein [Clavibacter zhangzhiyongii]|uniref:hypothetical protein n=1 Tax=Clavibacter zhangzhiyongii TaxID=2768071 RepID=UPI0039E177BF